MTPTFPMQTRITLRPEIAAALPSATSALALVNGEPGALGLVIAHTTMRAGIIGAGFLIAGFLGANVPRGGALVRNAVVGSLAIEAFVLGWAVWEKSRAPAVVVT